MSKGVLSHQVDTRLNFCGSVGKKKKKLLLWDLNHLNFIAYIEQVHKISVQLLHDPSYRNVSAFRSVKEFINLHVGVSEVIIFLLENKIK